MITIQAFWNKVEELKSKGFSIEQTSNQSDKGKDVFVISDINYKTLT